jgi:hypothetical protein
MDILSRNRQALGGSTLLRIRGLDQRTTGPAHLQMSHRNNKNAFNAAVVTFVSANA